MRKTTFIFAGIMSAIIGNAYATGENTVTSKSYVDNALEQKQNNITTEMMEFVEDENLMPAIATYDSTSGLVADKFGIVDYETVAHMEGGLFMFNDLNYDGPDLDHFVPTVRAVGNDLNRLNDNKQNKKVCAGWPDGTSTYDATHTDANCWLWTFPD